MKIGVFDSGLGGLTVVQALQQSPYAQAGLEVVYLGDTAHVPYGNKQPQDIRAWVTAIVDYLLKSQGVETLVFACNTSSALVLPHLKEEIAVPMFGILSEGCRAAGKVTSGRVGVLCNPVTAASGFFEKTLKNQSPEVEVTVQSCPDFVPLIESGQGLGKQCRKAAQTYLEPLLAKKVDTIILGCTHYPLITPVLKELAPKVRFINPAVHMVDRLGEQLVVEKANPNSYKYLVTDNPELFARNAFDLLELRFTSNNVKSEIFPNE